MEEVFSLSPLEYFCLCDSAPCRYDSVTSSVSRSLICSDVICHLLAHNADTHCHIVISISGGVEACCSSSFLLVRRLLSVYLYIRGVCAVHTTRTHCLLCPLSSWVRSWRNYPVKLERKWRGNTLRWYYLFTRRKKKKRHWHVIVIFWLFFFFLACLCHVGLRGCPAVGVCYEVPPVEQTISESSCSTCPLDWPIYPGGRGEQFTQVELRQQGDSALRWNVFLQSKLSE